MSDCPAIRLVDDSEDTDIQLNEFYEKRVELRRKTESFHIRNEPFTIDHVLRRSESADGHSLMFCAHQRPVISETLKRAVTFSDSPLLFRRKHRFYYCAMVCSPLLDKAVDANRTQFNLFKDRAETSLLDEITLAEIRREAVKRSRRYLRPYTKELRDRHWERIQAICGRDARYRVLLSQARERLERIDPSLESDEDLELAIYSIYRDVKLELKRRTRDISKRASQHIDDYESFRRELGEILDSWNQASMAELANYIVDRKAILAFLDNRLKRRDDDKFPLEEAVHRIFFPMGHTSDTFPTEDANLWIINEGLAFHRYMGSDRPIGTHEPIQSGSEKEPDIAVYQEQAFGAARSFADASIQPGCVTLVEFKRPGRNDYTRADNPFVQANSYITDIRNGKAQRPGGRAFNLREHTPFFVYIVCDITESLRRLAEEEYTLTPDGMGYFRYQPHYKAWIEVISYDKLVSDAKKRNKVLFDKLELPDLQDDV